jgi:hypothetical protein
VLREVVIFTLYGLRDPDGWLLLGADGESDEEADWLVP